MKNKSIQLYNEPAADTASLDEQLLNCLPVLIFVTDKNGRVLYVNKNFSKIIDHDPSANNISMKEIVNRADWDNWNENLFKLSNQTDEASCVFDIRFDSRDSGIKYLRLKGKVFKRDGQLKLLLYFFTGEDVTDEFKNGNASLAWKNFVSKSSTEKKLELAVKDLDRSNKDLEEFAYVASHDLQEPLRKITAYSSRLAFKFEDLLGDEGRLYLDKINAAANSMKELIENLLQLSRTVVHTQPFVPTDLNEIIDTVKQNLDLKIEESSARIIKGELPVAEVIASQMLQLFNNLLSNAIKFSLKEKPPVIHIFSQEISADEKERFGLSPNKTWYKITVKDNGIGFKQELAESIFKVFHRLNGKAEFAGTGIGLAICSKIIHKHNGLIWAESEPGKGASFFVILPKKQGD